MTTSIIYSIFLFFAMFSVAGAGLLFIQFHNQQKPYISSWAIGTLLMGLAIFLVVLRDLVPEFVAYKIGNSLIFASYFYFYYSAIGLLGKKITFGRIALKAFLAAFIFVVALILVGNNYGVSYQPALVALCGMVFNFLIGLLIFKSYKQRQISSAFALVAILFLTSLVWSVRCLMILCGDLGFALQGGIANVIFFLLLLCLEIAKYLFFAGLVVSIEWDEKKSLIDKNNQIAALLIEKEQLINGLLSANRTSATGALSASIAHELNQPLAAINLNIQFLHMKLGKNELSPELGAEVLVSLQRDTKRAADIIRSLRSIFLEKKIDAKPIDINELIEDTLVIIRPELRRGNIALNLELCDSKTFPMNRGEIQQVILNLLNNAIQALVSTEMANKAITITSEVHANTLRLSIADNGAGVPANRQDTLFELLSSSKQTGLGLGLWLCKYIVMRHGGKLWYEAAQCGGANFVMEFPVVIRK